MATTSDFGAQGEKPTHPELLDDLAARFIANGWRLKGLHREIMLSAAYRQASHPREDGLKADAANGLLWRMNPRRLDAEAFRDTILEAAGTLDAAVGGPSIDLDAADNLREQLARITGFEAQSPEPSRLTKGKLAGAAAGPHGYVRAAMSSSAP